MCVVFTNLGYNKTRDLCHTFHAIFAFLKYILFQTYILLSWWHLGYFQHVASKSNAAMTRSLSAWIVLIG